MANKFERREIKFIIPKSKLNNIKEEISKRVNGKNEKYTLCNIYYDTYNDLLIRRSIEKPIYKEKLRVRSYGVPSDKDDVFVEIKKKYKKIVYKRRAKLKVKDFEYNLNNLKDSQIEKEIKYFNNLYKSLEPKIFVSYERTAFNNEDIRISFDDNIIWRDYDLKLEKGIYGEKLLKDEVIMEIKILGSIPLWLTRLLSENRIFKTSFSKYGNIYKYKRMGDVKYG